jgi:hypothetical protein
VLRGAAGETHFFDRLSHARVAPLLARSYALRMPPVEKERAGEKLAYDRSSAYLDKVNGEGRADFPVRLSERRVVTVRTVPSTSTTVS